MPKFNNFNTPKEESTYHHYTKI